MRVASDTSLLSVEPGTSTGLTIDVVNTDDVIAGVSANIIGLATEFVSSRPQVLPLFPDSAGQVMLDLIVPPQHPAGRHPLTVEIVAHGTTGPPDYIDVDLDVAAHPGLRISAAPRIVRARRSARFVLQLVNTGNVALDVSLAGVDPDRLVEISFSPATCRIEPGAVAPVLLAVRGPRMFTGAELDRAVSVEATARPVQLGPRAGDATEEIARVPAHVHPDLPGSPGTATALLAPPAHPLADPLADPLAEDTAGEVVLVRETSVRLRQKPTISRGLLTILILLGIIGLWAAIFLFGLGKVFAGDPMTKQAPASFFASTAGAGTDGSGSGSGGGSGGSGGAAGGAGSGGGEAAPAGALPKSGQVPAGTGGAISGTVVSTTDQQPVGRILVTAYRQGPKGLIPMSTAATQSDGTYTLSGLFPTDYVLRFSRAGFTPVFYPNRPSASGAQDVPAVAQATTEDINARVTGLPATITGKVNPGDTRAAVRTAVVARVLVGATTGKTVATATTDANNSYTLRNLPAPGKYQLTFTTTGYQSSTLVDTVTGNDTRIEPTVTLGASGGQISGRVTDGTNNLGGATVTTTIGGKTVSVGTPTTGSVGQYVLGNLPTPATYVVTVSSPGRGAVTRVVDLGAGESETLNASLGGGTGSVTGRIVGPKGQGLGGVTVSVGGARNGGSTTTLTNGDKGRFVLNGLSPGAYTISARLAGYEVATKPVLLTRAATPNITIPLLNRLSSITGVVTYTVSTKQGNTVRKREVGLGGATVTATNGVRTFTAMSDTGRGFYRFDGLEPGTYSVTVTIVGRLQQTALVTVGDGKDEEQNIPMGA